MSIATYTVIEGTDAAHLNTLVAAAILAGKQPLGPIIVYPSARNAGTVVLAQLMITGTPIVLSTTTAAALDTSILALIAADAVLTTGVATGVTAAATLTTGAAAAVTRLNAIDVINTNIESRVAALEA